MHKARTAIPAVVILLLFIAWIMPGLIGRDLWKADEPYSFGLVNHIATTGDWVVPTLAGEPFMEKPPLLYLTGAAFVRAIPWLAPHDAARLAAGLFMMLTVLFLALISRELQSSASASLAAVVLIGCAGLQMTAHKLITDVALLTGFAVAWYGLALSLRRPALGGLWLGIGTGMAFLSKGLLGPGMIGVTALLLPAVSPSWRKKSYVKTLLIASLAALPLVVIWPLALYLRSASLFRYWFWEQNLGRFLGYSGLVGRRFSSFSYFSILPWFALPALPLALWAVWNNRKNWRTLPPAVVLPLTGFLVMFAVLSLSSSIRVLYALPMLLPLSLLAAGTESLGDRAKNILNACILVFFGMIAAGLWGGWLAMVSGWPTGVAQKLLALQPDYRPSVDGFLLVLAIIYTAGFTVAVARFIRAGYHPVLNWTAGITLSWALLMTIWLPWFDAGSGYRPLFASLQEALTGRHGVIASFGLGESERGLLEYYTGIRTRRFEVNNNLKDAELFLMETGSIPLDPPLPASWHLVWERKRPNSGRAKEIFRLFERNDTDGEQRKKETP